MRHIAIIGSGPAGYYTAEAAQKRWGDEVSVDIFDKLPVPYGLIRTGVAPDHQSIKAVARRYEKVALTDNIRFAGNVTIGADVTIEQLRDRYDAVVLATGAPDDRPLNLPGADLGNVFGSAAFVGWYNGHPEYAGLAPNLSGRHAVIVGMGNVALDVARILAKTDAEFSGSDIVSHALDRLRGSALRSIRIVGRRGPHQIMMTPKELGELNDLERAAPHVVAEDLPDEANDAMLEPGQRKSVALLRGFAAAPQDSAAKKAIAIDFDFFANPVAMEGDGTVRSMVLEKTVLTDGRAEGTGDTYTVPADMVVSCIGYRTSPIPDVPFDERMGRFTNQDGRIAPGLYCVGWARRGPSGTIGTNRPDGYALIDLVAGDLSDGPSTKQGRAGFDALAAANGIDVVTFRDWKRIEQAETAAARHGSPREKFVDIAAMIGARS